MENKVLYRVIACTVIFPIILFVIAFTIYYGEYKLINYYPQTYYRYATQGKSDKNIFWGGDIEKATNVDTLILSVIDTKKINYNRVQEFCKAINKNKSKLKETLENNVKYMKYLKDNDLTIDDFFSYTARIAALDDNLEKIGFYIGWLVLIYLSVIKLGMRSHFYFIAGIVYIFHIISQFSGSLSDNFFYYALLSKDHTYTYDIYISTVPILVNAFTEATLTFIIFDYLFQSYGRKWIDSINNFITELDIIDDGIKSDKITPDIIRNSWKERSNKFLKTAKKQIKKYKRDEILNKIFRHMSDSDHAQNKLVQAIVNTIEDLSLSKTINQSGYGKKIPAIREQVLELKQYYS